MELQQQQFDFHGHAVRVLGTEENPRFVLKDVCDVLGLGNVGMVMRRIDRADISRIDVRSERQVRNMVTVNESALYEVVLRSDKPEARRFSRWVTHEVLPTIRKHGAYMTEQRIEEVLTNPDTIIQLATNLKAEQEKRRQLEQKAHDDKPKVLFADAVSTSKTDILVGELAKVLRGNGIEVGGTRLFAWLRSNGFLIARKGSDWNMPTQRAMEMGLFRIKETTVVHSDGHTSISKTPKVTGKGQQYFVSRFLDGRFAA